MNYGIIGAGVIARDFAKAAVSEAAKKAGIRIAAVAARDLDRAQAFAGEFGIAKAYGSYEELFCDSEIDGVYIAVTHNFHTALTKEAAAHGKAVLCEKPFALCGQEAEEAIAFVREKKVLLMEAMWTRCLPSTLKAKEWIAKGKIGKVKLIEASFSFYSQRNPESRLYNPQTAGGALLDVGVYPIEFAMDFAGAKPVGISGAMQMGPTGVDEMNAISMLFENGVVAALSSGIGAMTRQDATVYGEKGSIFLPLFWGGSEAVLRNNEGEELERFSETNHRRDEGFVYEVLHFAKCFEEGRTESPLMPLDDTLTCARLFDEFKKNAAVITRD